VNTADAGPGAVGLSPAHTAAHERFAQSDAPELTIELATKPSATSGPSFVTRAIGFAEIDRWLRGTVDGWRVLAIAGAAGRRECPSPYGVLGLRTCRR
jgi:hypothetical protein